ncbi:efflux RND transporter periplasmic adaptor subunit [Neobacillus sp. PS3-34]|uniref:efflux RND transporter periplasmic adaptor subunit n=1 Tax=Neobacillus sp. PS3-34 TaxID=3070678 RepID=UPI0027DFBC0A|nr:efflux RND transporter periplasmic adaptor subunit [Neobacillus sp. PS3-34]WML47177.1 efflux RND transporter periplasmic adaptor subunit [Neobacillus sp. PS3-34]
MKKWIFIVLGLAVIAFVGYQYFNKNSTQEVSATYPTATVQKGKLEVKVSGSGSVQPVSSTDIKAESEKKIEEVLVDSGDAVTKGQELITFTDGSDPIIAPHKGIITSLTVSADQRVSVGEVVAHVTDYKNLQTVIQIDELDIPKIKVSQNVNIKANSFPDEAFSGKVTAISNEGTVTNGVSTFDVTIHIDNPKSLKVGMTAEASILTNSKDQALYVPVEAVHSINSQKYVVVSNGTAGGNTASTERKAVKTGLYNEDYVEITSGLTEGETVQLPAVSVNSNSNLRGMGRGGIGGFPGIGGGSGGRSWSGRSGGNGGRSGS